MFDSQNVKLMQAGLDALWMKQKAHANNIANVETVGYKAKKVEFKAVLDEKKRKGRMDINVFENQTTSARLDGNNVDMEQEQMELWSTYAQYSYMTNKASSQMKNIRYVINNSGR